MEKYIKQNNAVNIYDEHFVETTDQYSEPPSAKVVVLLRDPAGKRSVSSLSWQPEGSRKLAVAYQPAYKCSCLSLMLLRYSPEQEHIGANGISMSSCIFVCNIAFCSSQAFDTCRHLGCGQLQPTFLGASAFFST